MDSQTDRQLEGWWTDRQTAGQTAGGVADRQIDAQRHRRMGTQAYRVPYNYNPSTVEAGQEDDELAVACLK